MSTLFSHLTQHFNTYAPLSARRYLTHIITYIAISVLLILMFSEPYVYDTYYPVKISQHTLQLMPKTITLYTPSPTTIMTILFFVIDFFILSIRRLRSANRSGRLALWGLIPLYGTIAVIILCLKPKKDIDYLTL